MYVRMYVLVYYYEFFQLHRGGRGAHFFFPSGSHGLFTILRLLEGYMDFLASFLVASWDS